MSMQLRHVRGLALAAAAAALALGLALAVAAAADARGQATAIGLIATMNAPSEVPAPAGDVSGARGAFTATATQSGTGATLQWQMTFTGLTGPGTAAHIHVATRGQAGPVAVPLCGPCTSPASGTATVDATVLAALQSGGAYVNVHTDTNKAGEIRGQVGVDAPLRSALTSRQEVPKPKGNVRRAAGTFVAAVTTEGTTGSVTWQLNFARLSGRAVAAHIHIGRTGRAGPVAVALCGPCRSGQRGTPGRERGDARGARGGPGVRERAHAAEPRRRDPRADSRRRAPDHVTARPGGRGRPDDPGARHRAPCGWAVYRTLAATAFALRWRRWRTRVPRSSPGVSSRARSSSTAAS